MTGWIIPPPKRPTKTAEEFEQERADKVRWLIYQGLLRSEPIRQALLRVRREDFIPEAYRDYAYEEVPLPLPGEDATISCPHSYPLFYEPLGLAEGHRFLEVGVGSGYGAAIAREVVGEGGLVVSVELDPVTLEFARGNLARAGYTDIVTVLGDGGLGHPDLAPYDRIAVTAACPRIPPPLVEQLGPKGRIIAPVTRPGGTQDLTLLERLDGGLRQSALCEVLYLALKGAYGSEVAKD